MLQEDSSENDELFKSSLFFSCGKIFVQLQNALFHKLFFPYIPSCETHKQFGDEPAQYGLEINFKYRLRILESNFRLNFQDLFGFVPIL